jgi:hypothetical protein
MTAPPSTGAAGPAAHPAHHGAHDGAHDHSHDAAPLRDGVTAGAIGATAVALWFLGVDALAGRPLFTPAFLGGVLAGESDPALGMGAGRIGWAALYTPVHYMMFAVAGVAAVAVLRRVARTPALVALLIMLFMVFAVAFTGLVAVLERTALGTLAWYQIAAGALVAVITMGAYLYRYRTRVLADRPSPATT